MKRAWRDYVADILTAVQEVEDFTRGMEYEHFAVDRKTVNAVVRSLEVMGEAAEGIPEDVHQRYPDIQTFHGNGWQAYAISSSMSTPVLTLRSSGLW
jgi:uncharacterized protein with HEPN domain